MEPIPLGLSSVGGDTGLPILFRDAHLVAVHKPAGLLVHRSALDAYERQFALQRVRRQIGQRVYSVHRLDKATSGVLVFALTPEVGGTLSRLFATRQVEKTYLAVVRGFPAESGVIDHPLSRPTDTAVRSGAGPHAPPQPAVTGFRRLATVELPYRVDRYPTSRYALLALQPRTGRRHQLRRHLKHLSHPIIGDTTYGKGRHNHLFDTLFGCRRLLLACIELRLTHPVTAHPLVLTAPLEANFARVVQQLGWRKADVPGADFTNVLSGQVNLTRVVT